MRSSSVFVHSKAHVDPDVILGDGTCVWQFASVIRGAVIGKNVTVGACAVVDGASVGDRSTLGHGAQVHPGTIVENDVFVGPGVVICNDLWPAVTKDGFDAAGLKSRATVIIEAFASIGANSVILPGVRIGQNAVVAAGSRVTRDLPQNCVWRAENGYISAKPDGWTKRRMQWAR